MMPQPRQDPVSCESCRKKKLKCSRDQPCSNCTTRGVSCVFPARTSRVAVSSTPAQDQLSQLKEENAFIKARLSRLEDALLAPDFPNGRPTKSRRLAEWDDNTTTPSTAPSTYPETELTKTYKSDVQWLEGVGTRENSRTPRISADFDTRIDSIAEIERLSTSLQLDRCITLPPEEAALQLFSAYVREIDPMQHIIHIPTVRSNIIRLYERLRSNVRVEAIDAALLLSILASMASYWSPNVDQNATFESQQSASGVAILWLRQTLDLQEHIRRSASANLETIQSYVITAFLVYHLEGFSPKVRAIYIAGLSAAKDLGLHRIDAHPNQTDPTTDVVDTEIRRRVWWHIACTDWTFALAGGPHEGTYNVNPRHMKVNRPRNVSDEELETAPLDFTRPLSEPTVMGYHLQRIRLSEISRDMTDLTHDMEEDNIPARDVASLDAKLRNMLAELPAFLQVDNPDRNLTNADGMHQSSTLQRYMVNLALHAKRCRFHLPLLLRKEAEYSFSRDACLESARAVIRLKMELIEHDFSLWISNSKLGGFLHLFFYATVVLLVDFCVNRDIVDEAERGEEIQRALKTLELAKQRSVTAGLYLDSLMAALRKHKIRLELRRHEGSESAVFDPVGNPSSTLSGGFETGKESVPADFDLDELWQSYINSEMTIDWGPLLDDLQTCAWDQEDAFRVALN